MTIQEKRESVRMFEKEISISYLGSFGLHYTKKSKLTDETKCRMVCYMMRLYNYDFSKPFDFSEEFFEGLVKEFKKLAFLNL